MVEDERERFNRRMDRGELSLKLATHLALKLTLSFSFFAQMKKDKLKRGAAPPERVLLYLHGPSSHCSPFSSISLIL